MSTSRRLLKLENMVFGVFVCASVVSCQLSVVSSSRARE